MISLVKKTSDNLFETTEKAKNIRKLNIFFPEFDLSKTGHEFIKFEKLEDLHIQTHISYSYNLPNQIGTIKTITNLTILNINYREFPEWIFNLTNLKSLIFRGNDTEYLPEEIYQLTNLKKLRVENCYLKEIPSSMYRLKNLQSLSLIDNFKIQWIEPNHLPINLKKLDIAPSNISDENKRQIKEIRPEIRLG